MNTSTRPSPVEVPTYRVGRVGGVLESGQRGSVWLTERAGRGDHNSCFSGNGYPGDERWRTWLSRLRPHAARCLWATAPDVVGDVSATLFRARQLLPAIRDLGFPAALVAQEGLKVRSVPWSEFDVLFIGGRNTAWKLGPAAAALIAEAHRREIPVHMGRVNSQRRWNYARMLGCQSVDGTFLTYAPDRNLARLRQWIHTTPSEAHPDATTLRQAA